MYTRSIYIWNMCACTYMYTYTYKYKIQISYKYTCIADNRTNILNEVLVGFYIVINGRAQLKVIICLCLKQLPSLEPFILKYPLNSQALSSKTYIGNISICKKEQEYAWESCKEIYSYRFRIRIQQFSDQLSRFGWESRREIKLSFMYLA